MSNNHVTSKGSQRQHHGRLIRKRGKKVGAAPGTLIHIGAINTGDTRISRILYSPTNLEEATLTQATECAPPAAQSGLAWFNIDGLHHAEVIKELGGIFTLHPLIMEDILNTDHRPKIEVHDDYLYIVLKMLQFRDDSRSITIEQISLIIGDNYVLSFQERAGDVFDGVRERLRTGRRIRQMGADYLAYALIDAIVDNYFLILEKLGDAIEDLEQELIDNPTPATLHTIHHFKREMLLLRKAVWPLREVLSSLSRDEDVVSNSEIRLFLRDVYDHSIHIMDNIDTLRDMLTGLLDLYVSSVSQRMNEIMKVLTIFASIFMPLTFIAGVYGMNFEYMPELAVPWAYPLVLLIMLGVSGGLILFFKWRNWL